MHRAIVLDEARIRCSARSRQPRRCAGFLRNRIENYAEERPGLGNKGLPARRLDDSETPTELTHDLLPLLVDESHERLRGLFGAEPDIEFGRGMRRNYIGRLVANIDTRDRERGGLELVVAAVEHRIGSVVAIVEPR